jgi:tryptophan-rich sensory protein
VPQRRPILIAVLCAVTVALIGGAITDTGPWYRALEKSDLTPPDWVFGPAWTVIYALCAIAAVHAWRIIDSPRNRAWLISLFLVNAILNIGWSAAFFALRRPDWALAEVITLWLSVASLVVFLYPRDRLAGLMIVPYLVWVAFAAYLNTRVVALNGPFT